MPTPVNPEIFFHFSMTSATSLLSANSIGALLNISVSKLAVSD
jgi:hypothetical protein